jgi:hypothetical protein
LLADFNEIPWREDILESTTGNKNLHEIITIMVLD